MSAAAEVITQAQVNAIEHVLVGIHNAGRTYTFESVAQQARQLYPTLLASLDDDDLIRAVTAIWDGQIKHAQAEAARKGAH